MPNSASGNLGRYTFRGRRAVTQITSTLTISHQPAPMRLLLLLCIK